jgi:hypothetical protein
MRSEIVELNKILCRDCSETKYERCLECRVYKLINSLVY